MDRRKLTVFASLLLLLGAAAMAGATDDPRESVARRLSVIRQEQALLWARQDGVELPASAQGFFRAAQYGTWTQVRSPFRFVSAERPLKSAWLFPLIHDVYGAYEQEDMWHPELLDQFAEDVLHGIPDGSVYFGGSSPGRFIVTAWQRVHNRPSIAVLTHKGLVDSNYIEYVNRLYQAGIWLPNEADQSNARRRLEKEVQSGKRPRTSLGAWMPTVINGILAKDIFDRNRPRRQFFVEGTVPRWMMPHLEPHGLVMKLNVVQARSIAGDTVIRDREFWDGKERDLLADQRFMECPAARRTYSKCRSAIGGLYAKRGMLKESEYAFRQAIRIYPLEQESYYRLAQEVLLRQERFDDARALLQELKEAGPDAHLIAYIVRLREGYSLRIGDKEEAERIEKGQTDGFYRRIDNFIDHLNGITDQKNRNRGDTPNKMKGQRP